MNDKIVTKMITQDVKIIRDTIEFIFLSLVSYFFLFLRLLLYRKHDNAEKCFVDLVANVPAIGCIIFILFAVDDSNALKTNSDYPES